MIFIMKSRNDFPSLFNRLNLINVGVEVGVFRGGFSDHILNNWNGKLLYSIDSWKNQNSVMDVSDVSQEEHDKNYIECKNRLKYYKNRSIIIRDFLFHHLLCLMKIH